MSESGTARGTFDVEMGPATAVEPPLGSMTITKTWHGDLQGTGRGLMLSAGDPANGVAGYVAVEVAEGALGERSGSLAFQQFGTMQPGGQEQIYQVAPGSGTGDLAGITGTLKLDIDEDGKHSYTLDWTID